MESKVVSIQELQGFEYIIPEFQRGYRWKKKQVEELLDDLLNASSKEGKYYLQPITLVNDDNKYILLDGQQRLTTILIILDALNANKIFTLRERDSNISRNEQVKAKLTKGICPKEINRIYMKNAQDIIKKYIQEHNLNKSFLNYIEEKVMVLKYVIEKEISITKFINMNTNHIKLNLADLIKAEFLKSEKNKFEISKSYSEIERSLYNDKLWYFISNDLSKDRMTYFMEITANKSDYFNVYDYYKRKLIDNDNLKIWQEIIHKNIILNCLYSDYKLYNLIGYLVTKKKTKKISIDIHNDVFLEYEKLYKNYGPKIDFYKHIYSLIDKDLKVFENVKNVNELKMKLEGNDISYNHNNKIVYNVLLLHNVLTSNNNKEKFHFDEFRKENWHLEHVNSVTENSLKSEENKNNYLAYLKVKFINKYFNELLNNNLERCPDYLKINNIKNVDGKVLLDFNKKEFDEEDKDINCINNLVLLDSTTNESYKNNLFMIKRKIILETDKFVPICTKKVFLKEYSKSNVVDNIYQFYEWNRFDEQNYLDDISKVLYKIKENIKDE